jgi:hypothetical protein
MFQNHKLVSSTVPFTAKTEQDWLGMMIQKNNNFSENIAYQKKTIFFLMKTNDESCHESKYQFGKPIEYYNKTQRGKNSKFQTMNPIIFKFQNNQSDNKYSFQFCSSD